ncbi:MAG: hypothetical protein JWL97_3794 [Gemmatimonadales bacterium]|nr:hypothetical protein [Gemmatimonadales bacterium]
MVGRKASFWLAVAGVSVLAQIGLEVLTQKFPNVGLARLTATAHQGGQ